jgi:hypothetical protein
VTVRRSIVVALAVAWSAYAVAVVLAWREAAAAAADADSQLFPAAAWGLIALLLTTSWLYGREGGR